MDNETTRSTSELLDLYHIWRTLFQLCREILSGAEVYGSVATIRKELQRLELSILDTYLSDRDEEIPEHFIEKEIRQHGDKHDRNKGNN